MEREDWKPRSLSEKLEFPFDLIFPGVGSVLLKPISICGVHPSEKRSLLYPSPGFLLPARFLFSLSRETVISYVAEIIHHCEVSDAGKGLNCV